MTPVVQTSNQDALDFLRGLGDESVDLVLTDPPYESLERHRKAGGTTGRLKHSKASSNDWFEIFPNARFSELLSELYRVLRTDRHCYIQCDQETMHVLKPLAEGAGFKWWKGIVWDKVAIGMGYHYRARHEMIVFLEKGKRRLADLAIPDILTAKRVYRGYPTEKPVPLLKTLVSQSTGEGELVLDPFMGSGSTGVAAVELGRFFLGNDLCAEAVEIATSRLEQAVDNR